MIAGPQDVADRRHSLVQDGKIDCEGAAASPSGILGSPSENGDLRRGHIGSWRFTDDERIEDIVRCRSYDGIYSPFLTPHRRTFGPDAIPAAIRSPKTCRKSTVTGTPKVAFTLGAATRQAAYASSSGTAELVFSYTVRAGEIDTDGISWQANALTLAGGTVRLTTTDPNVEEDAALAHADGQSEHRVDADPPGLVAEVPLTMQGTVLELD